MQEELESVKAEQERARKEEKEIGSAAMIRILEHPGMSSKALGKKISELEGRLNLMSTIYTAFISVAPDVDTTEFLKDASSVVAGNGRYRLICSQAGKIEFGDISVDFATSQH